MKPFEARRALGEMRAKLSPEHLAEVEARVEQAERDAIAAPPDAAAPDPASK